MKKELGDCTSLFNLCFLFSSSAGGCSKSISFESTCPTTESSHNQQYPQDHQIRDNFRLLTRNSCLMTYSVQKTNSFYKKPCLLHHGNISRTLSPETVEILPRKHGNAEEAINGTQTSMSSSIDSYLTRHLFLAVYTRALNLHNRQL